MNLSQIVKILDEKLDINSQYSWDNSGLLVENQDKKISKILATLEVSDSVIDEAIDSNCDMIISHHPLFIKPINSLSYKNIYQSYAIRLIKNNIPLYSCHTNYDKLRDGLNDFVIKILDIQNPEILVTDESSEDYGLGRIANLTRKMNLDEFINYIKKSLNIDSCRYIGKKDIDIKRLAIVTGAGSDFIKIAFEKGADIFLTGDMKYHDSQESHFYGYNILDIGHYGSEKFFPQALIKTLAKVLPGIEIIKSEKLLNPIITCF